MEVKMASTEKTTHCDKCGRIFRTDTENTCPGCVRLIQLGIDPIPSKN